MSARMDTTGLRACGAELPLLERARADPPALEAQGMNGRRARTLTFAIMLAVSWPCAAAQGVLPESIEVFSSARSPVATDAPELAVAVTVYDLDAPARTEAALSAGLPASEAAAMAEAKRRLAALSQTDQASIRSSFEGLLKALQYGINRYPAIVFDGGQAVVYGHDLQEAIGHYQRWRRAGTHR